MKKNHSKTKYSVNGCRLHLNTSIKSFFVSPWTEQICKPHLNVWYSSRSFQRTWKPRNANISWQERDSVTQNTSLRTGQVWTYIWHIKDDQKKISIIIIKCYQRYYSYSRPSSCSIIKIGIFCLALACCHYCLHTVVKYPSQHTLK